jgi:hypothetical protein
MMLFYLVFSKDYFSVIAHLSFNLKRISILIEI